MRTILLIENAFSSNGCYLKDERRPPWWDECKVMTLGQLLLWCCQSKKYVKVVEGTMPNPGLCTVHPGFSL